MTSSRKRRIAFLNNIVTPYRIPLYEGLAQKFETHLLLSGHESNRSTWKGLDNSLENVHTRTVFGFTVQFFEKRKGQQFDPRYLHINPGYLWALLQIKPDAVISTEMGFRSIVALCYGWLFRKPVWILWGGTIHTEQKRSALKKLIRRLIFKRATRWISYGQTTTDYLLELGVSRSCILQMQNFVDESLYISCTRKYVELTPKPVLLYAGQMIKRKGVGLFIDAAADLQKEGHVFSVLLVGDGIEKESLIQRAREAELENVTVLPPQPPSQMPAVYKSADFFIFPTLEDVWGLVVNEALWSGLTVLASMYAGCAQELLPSENIFDPCCRDSFEKALRSAVSGSLAQPNTTVLKKCSDVVNAIVDEINQT